jgi:large subunit ribosomal protein L29|tara:strand:+ start:138 stop:338 length:201 start_codon:yes stop_codon:yes gene_type:complete
MMTGTEVRALKDEEITVELKRLRSSLLALKSKSVTEKIEDTTQFGKVRKDIARLLTEQTARQNKDS